MKVKHLYLNNEEMLYKLSEFPPNKWFSHCT